jgi:hypothetical protein
MKVYYEGLLLEHKQELEDKEKQMTQLEKEMERKEEEFEDKLQKQVIDTAKEIKELRLINTQHD